MIEYVFFDLDGTLTDPALGITNSFLYALEKMGRPKPPREELYRFIGPPLYTSFREYFGMTEEETEYAITSYREYFSVEGLFENTPYAGVHDMLGRLKNNGYKLCVATSKPEKFAVRILEHFGLAEYFTEICGASTDISRNTKTAVLEYLLEKINISLSGCRGEASDSPTAVMIGDRHHDIDGAKDVGIPSIGVLWGFGSEEELREAGADYIVSNMNDMVTIIEKL